MTATIIQLAYLFAAALFLLALRSLGQPSTARRGMQMAAFGMLIAVCATLLDQRIVSYEWLAVGVIAGGIVGYPMGMWVPMTAMPQRIAFSHAFGALAATLVGVGEYLHGLHEHTLTHGQTLALGFEVFLGSLTVTGSLMAFGKLQELLPGAPITFRGQNVSNLLLFSAGVVCLVWLVVWPYSVPFFIAIAAVGLLVGILMVLPIGGADMPVVVSLLNSYAGLAAVATGFALDNNILIVVGALDGASGFILSMAMSKAMNRSFTNILFGAFGAETGGGAVEAGGSGGEMVAISADDAALRLAFARRVIIVPGYGLAVAQAQHQVRELVDLMEKRGVDVRFAIHPVAGRMPGHMNVLLAEAGVSYDKLVDMEDINERFADADVALVVGANDVVNPAARTNRSSPIYGMPILNVQDARSIIVLKRGRGKGFSGVENDLFVSPKTNMLFGDAKQSIMQLGAEVKLA
ncbi:NAD(P)(+) transhydrogenase (Re/Si-specific) subunit beta [Sinorhizobium meliloti]|uniref:NAD(P)(+) transhydrogenase (Re/Si-specific) subunit beta n=1 Tax=Rhizobium meliloti TaxID=382 RepID=UPI0002A58DBD|nr:NAD(P)(+) transhydrogenase (Re/Si-specific) subunit beta [Sinorhizobium meliloti]AGA08809.1 NAD/NADP transhydrogenase beta subunit [Sinorhizobium meliloti GR4]RVL03691.1 NAD(P)(+) transhydrogenase (Re/Si-specific) subunit beta [Sinorhizobium meliloti]RVM95236.1 NAD(P)(+) transhydrogenase (Re/Si-specific) subunit beta [Sinorhizobium meliloti]RVN14314.1 NAD(P)(+) transhydrogenase (Re/Si-specific) subunit beta [Sinorhizobium meliloti]